MKSNNTKRVNPALTATLAVLAISAMALTGCGKSDGGTPIVTGGVGVLPGTTGVVPGVGVAGCVPVNQPIPFQATNIYFDSANMVGGIIPGGGAVGSTIVGGGVIGAGTHHNIAGDATIVANITPGGAFPGSYPYAGYVPVNNYQNYAGAIPYQTYGNFNYPGAGGQSTANVQGTISIGQLALQDLYLKFSNGGINNTSYFNFPSNNYYQPYSGYYYPGYQNTPYNTTGVGNVCVSQIAFDLGHWDSHGLIYGGRIYLYLNGTQHGYVLWI